MRYLSGSGVGWRGGVVYWLMADALIKLEKGLYAKQANDVMWAQWRVVEKGQASSTTMTFVFEPADATPATPGGSRGRCSTA